MNTTLKALPVGSTIGIFGSGQLGMMLCWSASQLGYKTLIYSDVSGCACHVATGHIIAPYDDIEALKDFAKRVDVITCEFENIPTSVFAVIGSLQYSPRIYPGHLALSTSQDRRKEKVMAKGAGFETSAFRFYQKDGVGEGVQFGELGGQVSFPAILKTATGGYDGRGQKRVESEEEAQATWEEFGFAPCVLEQLVDFKHEFSMILVRGQDGDIRFYPPLFNSHSGGILQVTRLNQRLNSIFTEENMRSLMVRCTEVANKLDVVGLLAVEMFWTRDGKVLFNEIAPRPHNSGHITLDCTVTSQFNQHIRAVVGLPLGSCQPLHDGQMHNFIGEVRENAEKDCGGNLYLYGKEAKPGRKLGHLNFRDRDFPWISVWHDRLAD